MGYKVKADERLFNLFVSVSHGVRNLGAIVQNDYELTPEQYMQWAMHASNTRTLLDNLIKDTMNHIDGLGPEKK